MACVFGAKAEGGRRKVKGGRRKAKAIALISGGLDSLLAARVVMDQGIEVLGLAFVMTATSTDAEKAAEDIKQAASGAKINVRVVDISEEFTRIILDPAHGYGKNMNPCIDCKIAMIRKALKVMREENADFIITGEVLGERPMSQNRRSLDLIQERSGAGGYLLRPLSAGRLPETDPEKEGLVDRSKLLDISGRSRKRQLELAARYGLKKFSAPGASCLLTDPGFSRRVKDLIKHGCFTLKEIDLLKTGRHFRVGPRTKVVVGRDAEENQTIRKALEEGDVLLRLSKEPGPDALLRGRATEKNLALAAALVVAHSRSKNRPRAGVSAWKAPRQKRELNISPLSEKEMERMRI